MFKTTNAHETEPTLLSTLSTYFVLCNPKSSNKYARELESVVVTASDGGLLSMVKNQDKAAVFLEHCLIFLV